MFYQTLLLFQEASAELEREVGTQSFFEIYYERGDFRYSHRFGTFHLIYYGPLYFCGALFDHQTCWSCR